jgi:hypothetical protein
MGSASRRYRWKAECGGVRVSEAHKLKTLKDENRRLKKLLGRRCRTSRPSEQLNTPNGAVRG